MKKYLLSIVSLFLFFGVTSPVYAGTITDDFNDGNADGWIMGAACSSPSWCGTGNWRVENNYVTQDYGRDGHMLLLDGYSLTDQKVQAKILWHDMGVGGLAVWRQNDDNWIFVNYPYHDGFMVVEKWCDTPLCPRDENVVSTIYPYHFPERVWQTLELVTHSSSGEIDVYLDDIYIFTHLAGQNIRRSGLSGFVSGNAGADFDDFSVTSSSIVDPLTNKDQCKKGGWQLFTDPIFKNQGACVSYFENNLY